MYYSIKYPYNYEDMSSKIKNSSFLIFFIPILINTLKNIVETLLTGKFNSINIFNAISVFLLFLFLVNVGSVVKSCLNLKSKSFGIIVFIFSFFIVDIVLLYFYSKASFNEIFIVVNLAWLIIFLLNKKFLETSLILLFYIATQTFNSFYFNRLSKNFNLIGDVEAYFYPQAKNIYENSYYFSVTNFITEGYPQFTSYIQALFLRFSVDLESFVYINSTTQIIFLLSILFFFELKVPLKNKLFIISIFSSIIFNSKWIQFMFTNSLMSEGVVSLFSAVLVYEVFNSRERTFLPFLSLGILYFTKQFLSTIILLLIIFLIFKRKDKKFVYFGFLGLFLKETLFTNVFSGLSSSRHLDQIDIPTTIKEILTFTNLNFMNIISIAKNVFLDKPLTLLIVGLFFLILTNLYKGNNLGLELNSYVLIILVNFFFILLLYISAWQNMELESPVRYIWSFFHLKLTIVSLLINKLGKTVLR